MSGYGSIARRWVWLIPSIFLLSACNTTDPAKIQAKVGETLPIVCAAMDVAWMGWQAYLADHTIKAATLGNVNGAYFAAKEVCANPPTDIAEGVAAAGKAYFAFSAAVKAAKNGVSP